MSRQGKGCHEPTNCNHVIWLHIYETEGSKPTKLLDVQLQEQVWGTSVKDEVIEFQSAGSRTPIPPCLTQGICQLSDSGVLFHIQGEEPNFCPIRKLKQ